MEILNLVVDDANAAVDFYPAALGGVETSRECLPDGHVLFAEVAAGGYRLQISERVEPATAEVQTDAYELVCADPEGMAARCAAAGALIQSDGRTTIRDLAGYRWTFCAVR